MRTASGLRRAISPAAARFGLDDRGEDPARALRIAGRRRVSDDGAADHLPHGGSTIAAAAGGVKAPLPSTYRA